MTTLVQTQPDWLAALRAAGAARFGETGLPTQRQEAWKYTGLNKLKALTFEPAPLSLNAPPVGGEVGPEARVGGDGAALLLSDSGHQPPHPSTLRLADLPLQGGGAQVEDAAHHHLTFCNGRFDAAQSQMGALPDGVILGSLSAVLKDRPGVLEPHIGKQADIARHAMVALNTAWIEDGLVLIVPRGVELAGPIEVTFITDGETPVSHPRHLIALGDNASAVVVERHVGGAAGGFVNAVTEVTLAPAARLGHYAVHEEPANTMAIDTIFAHVGRDALYRAFGLTAGGALIRREIEAQLAAPGGSAQVDGAYLVDGDRHADTTVLIDHQAPHCASRQTQKGIIDGDGRAVFQGKILVRPDAQKTDGYQLSQTLLLSQEAEIDVKPELEIHADDVKCSHGATVGRLDADALFFLRARGIPEAEARALLIQGFIGGALDEIDHPAVRTAFGAVAANWLAFRSGGGHSGPESTA